MGKVPWSMYWEAKLSNWLDVFRFQMTYPRPMSENDWKTLIGYLPEFKTLDDRCNIESVMYWLVTYIFNMKTIDFFTEIMKNKERFSMN